MNKIIECKCMTCLKQRQPFEFGLPIELMRLIVCEICGNKRCPHGIDHRNACNNSNEPIDADR